MDPANVLVGIDADARIQQGQFFRLTFGRTRHLGFPFSVFAFDYDMRELFATLDSADGWAMPASDLAVPPGGEAAVFDVLVRPVAIGVTAADLANYFNELRAGVSLTSMTPVDVHAVQAGSSDRDQLQSQLDAAERRKDPLAVFGQYAKLLEWTLLALLAVALLYYGSKAFKVAKAAI